MNIFKTTLVITIAFQSFSCLTMDLEYVHFGHFLDSVVDKPITFAKELPITEIGLQKDLPKTILINRVKQELEEQNRIERARQEQIKKEIEEEKKRVKQEKLEHKKLLQEKFELEQKLANLQKEQSLYRQARKELEAKEIQQQKTITQANIILKELRATVEEKHQALPIKEQLKAQRILMSKHSGMHEKKDLIEFLAHVANQHWNDNRLHSTEKKSSFDPDCHTLWNNIDKQYRYYFSPCTRTIFYTKYNKDSSLVVDIMHAPKDFLCDITCKNYNQKPTTTDFFSDSED